MNNNQAFAHLPIGKTIGDGKYKITRLIGSGPFGCTYEAEYILMESKVAIKEFFLEAYCSRDAQGAVIVSVDSQAPIVARYEERFLAEARGVYKLQHPGIMRVTDIIQENGTSYFVSEYVEGQSLQDIIDREGKLTEDRALRYVGQAMKALQLAHANQALHLNIQPSNILIDSNDNAVLIGFGSWKLPDMDELASGRTVLSSSSQEYAPVEQLSAAQLTPATDIYSLGATLYAALTGTKPPSSLAISSGAANLTPLPDNVSMATKSAVDAMMQPSVKARPQSVDQIMPTLIPAPLPAPAPMPAEIDAPQPPKPIQKPKKKRGARVWIIIIACVLVLAGGALGGWLAYTHLQAKQAIKEQMAAEKAVNEHYKELKYLCEKDIEYGNKNIWKPLINARLLLDSLKCYSEEYADFEHYPLDDSGLRKMEEDLKFKTDEAKATWIRAAKGQYEIAEDYSAAIQYWHNAALLSPDADVKEAMAKFAKDQRCPAAHMAVYKASASDGKLIITYYGLSDKPVKGVVIEYAFDGKSGSSKVNIEPGFNTFAIDVDSDATRGLLALSCNGLKFYNQELDN